MNTKLLISISFVFLSGQAYPCDYNVSNDEPIPIRPTVNNSNTHRPNSKAVVPFEAYYDTDLSSILLYFINDVGDVEIAIQNLSSEESYYFTINSSIGSIILPISGNLGYYEMTFTLQNGKHYIGEFLIK